MLLCCSAGQPWPGFVRVRQAQLEQGKLHRAFLASECNELPKAEKWRRQIISEVSKKVAQIQNAGLGEFKIRDLNDEINKLVGLKMLDREGKEVPGNRGYKYFGAAKDLAGVRELFEREPVPAARKTPAELMKDIDAGYYGYRDEDGGALVPLEQEYEFNPGLCFWQYTAEAGEKWKAGREAGVAAGGGVEEEEYIYTIRDEESDDETREQMEGEDGSQSFVAHVPVPSQKVEAALVRRKKMERLQKYTSESLMAQSEEATALLGL
uniref:Pre-mRNA-splicing factor ISY1 homolog n=1 Tax=Sinocyclocheilus rhinocerous TaxID=307959 RepID=A0A673I5L4_9TELE